jgi:methylmalonyl-CoA mutase
MDLDPYNWEIILTWNEKINKYKNPVYTFKVREKMPTHTESLSFSTKIALPKAAWGDIYAGVYRKMFLENIRSPLVYIL